MSKVLRLGSQSRNCRSELATSPAHRRCVNLARIVVVGIAICLGACGGVPQVPEPDEVVEGIMGDLAAARWGRVFALLDDPVRGECGSPDRLGGWIESHDARPQAQSWRVLSKSVRKTRALVSGELVSTSGKTLSFGLGLSLTESGWRPTTWSTANREVCQE